MEALKSLIVSVFGICISMVTSIAVFVYGWGLSPKSWWWIIGMNLIGNISAILIIQIAKIKD